MDRALIRPEERWVMRCWRHAHACARVSLFPFDYLFEFFSFVCVCACKMCVQHSVAQSQNVWHSNYLPSRLSARYNLTTVPKVDSRYFCERERQTSTHKQLHLRSHICTKNWPAHVNAGYLKLLPQMWFIAEVVEHNDLLEKLVGSAVDDRMDRPDKRSPTFVVEYDHHTRQRQRTVIETGRCFWSHGGYPSIIAGYTWYIGVGRLQFFLDFFQLFLTCPWF